MHVATNTVGCGWARPVPSLVFAEMVERAAAVQQAFRGDLFHDAFVLDDILKPLSTRCKVTMYWALRRHGTHLTRSQAEADAVARNSRGSTLYRITVREGAPGRLDWTVTFETLAYYE